MPSNNLLRQQYLQTMGVQVWQERATDIDVQQAPLVLESMDLDQLNSMVADCRRCGAYVNGCTRSFSMGRPKARPWVLITDKPVQHSTASAQLLADILSAVEQKLESSYLTSSIKCVDISRSATLNECMACQPYLLRQIELLQPSMILVLGELAAQSLLSTDKRLKQLRGKDQSHVLHVLDTAIPVIVTHHPDDTLKDPQLKRLVWEDVQLAKAGAL